MLVLLIIRNLNVPSGIASVGIIFLSNSIKIGQLVHQYYGGGRTYERKDDIISMYVHIK
jgi:hypothetical protein